MDAQEKIIYKINLLGVEIAKNRRASFWKGFSIGFLVAQLIWCSFNYLTV